MGGVTDLESVSRQYNTAEYFREEIALPRTEIRRCRLHKTAQCHLSMISLILQPIAMFCLLCPNNVITKRIPLTALNSLLLYASDLLVMSLIECYINGVLQTYGSSGSSSNSNEEVYLEVDENEPEIKSSSHHSFQPQAKPSGVNFPSISDNIFMDENLENKYTDEKLEMIEKKKGG